VWWKRGRGEGQEQGRSGSEDSHRLNLGEPPGSAPLVGRRGGLRMDLGLTAPDLETRGGDGGRVPRLLRGAPTSFALVAR